MKSSDILIMSVSFLADFTRAVAVRPISYAAVLRMKQDSSSSLLNSRSRPRPHGGGGPATPDWPVFQSHPLPALSLLSSQEDYRSEGKLNLLCCYLLLSDVCSELSPGVLMETSFSGGIHVNEKCHTNGFLRSHVPKTTENSRVNETLQTSRV